MRPPIIENLHFVGRNPSKILSNFGRYKIVVKKLLLISCFFKMLLPEKMLYLLPDIPSASLIAYYQVPALCTSSSWCYFLCHAQKQNFDIFATKCQSEFESSTAAKEDVAYYQHAQGKSLFYQCSFIINILQYLDYSYHDNSISMPLKF